MAGADFDEGADTSGMHRFNLLHEIDWVHDLVCQQLARVFFRFGIFRTGRVGIHRHCALAKFHRLQRSGEGRARIGHQGAVKRRRHRQHAAADRTFGQRLSSTRDLLQRAREHKLFWRIAVGDDQSTVFLAQKILHRGFVRLHCQHGTPAGSAAVVCHQASAQIRQLMQRRRADTPRRA